MHINLSPGNINIFTQPSTGIGEWISILLAGDSFCRHIYRHISFGWRFDNNGSQGITGVNKMMNQEIGYFKAHHIYLWIQEYY